MSQEIHVGENNTISFSPLLERAGQAAAAFTVNVVQINAAGAKAETDITVLVVIVEDEGGLFMVRWSPTAGYEGFSGHMKLKHTASGDAAYASIHCTKNRAYLRDIVGNVKPVKETFDEGTGVHKTFWPDVTTENDSKTITKAGNVTTRQ